MCWRALRFIVLRTALVCSASLLFGCGAPDPRVVALDADDGPIGNTVRPRGRVRVQGGDVVTDQGSRLRGVTVSFDVGGEAQIVRSSVESIARSIGLNAIHVFLESWAQPTGTNAAQAELLVNEAERAGLYVIIAIGGGVAAPDHPGNGWFDLEKVRSFWSYYAPLYAHRTHVLFEIQNNPELVCDVAFKPETIAMQREAYSLIREVAPDTHISLFSYAALPTAAALNDAIAAVADVVDFSNASVVAQGRSRCTPLETMPTLVAGARAAGVPMLVTEVPPDGLASVVRLAEASSVGWFLHSWPVAPADFEAFRQEHESAGLAWCPDFGRWPENSTTCQSP